MMGTLILNEAIIQYRTGKTLGSGTYAIVKEAVHLKTGKYYACKVINRKFMEGRESMVRLRLICFLLGHTNMDGH